MHSLTFSALITQILNAVDIVAQLKLDTYLYVWQNSQFFVSLGVTCALLTRLLHAHASNISNVIH